MCEQKHNKCEGEKKGALMTWGTGFCFCSVSRQAMSGREGVGMGTQATRTRMSLLPNL